MYLSDDYSPKQFIYGRLKVVPYSEEDRYFCDAAPRTIAPGVGTLRRGEAGSLHQVRDYAGHMDGEDARAHEQESTDFGTIMPVC